MSVFSCLSRINSLSLGRVLLSCCLVIDVSTSSSNLYPTISGFHSKYREARILRSCYIKSFFFLLVQEYKYLLLVPLAIQGSETLMLFYLDHQRANQENYSGKEKWRVTIHFDFLILVQEAQFP